MLRFLNKISKGLALSHQFKSTNKRYLFVNYQNTRLFSSQANSIDDLLSKAALAEKDQDAKVLMDLYNLLGSSYKEKGDLNQSTVYYEKAAKIAENKLELNNADLRNCFLNLGDCYRASNSPEKSIEWYEKALKIEKSLFGEQSKEVAWTLTDLIPVYQIINDAEKAEQALISAFPYMETQINSNNRSAAAYFLYSGNIYSAKNDPRRAIEDWKKSRNIFKSSSGQFTLEIAIVDVLIAMDYWKINEVREAEKYLQGALNIRESLKIYDMDAYKKLALLYKQTGNKNAIKETVNKATAAINETSGINSLELVKFYVDLAEKFKSVDEHEDSRELYAKSLEALKKIPDQVSLEIATYYEFVASEANEYSEFDKVIDCIQSAVKIKNTLGMDSKNFMQNWLALGYAYYNQTDYEKSEKYFLQAKEILEQQNSDNERLFFCLKYLDALYIEQKKFPESEAIVNRIIILKSQLVGKIHPDVASAYFKLGILYKFWGKAEKSIENIKKSIEINDQALGSNNLDKADYLAILGGVYFELREFEKAAIEHKRAIDIRTSVIVGKDPEIGSFYHALGGDYREMGNFDKALEFFNKGLQSDLQTHGDNDIRVGRGYLYIGETYEKIGNKNTAIENFQKSQLIFASIPEEFEEFVRIQAKIQKLNKQNSN
ncbi:unnamed protein product [Blepharisma stoltei]|uniref:Tetratricopeptide repeat protein n=1 Tax=Blepharisma stoltei TaxID=1481888 RepID=A0AAU9K7L5_9CILI|nr:unnamed protein product [Blepharisma stoltei]